MCRVVAKKIVSQLMFSLSRPPSFLLKKLGTKFLSPIFHNALNAGLPSLAFARWWTQYMEREHAEQDSILITLFAIVVLIPNAVRNLIPNFQTVWYGSDIINDCACIT